MTEIRNDPDLLAAATDLLRAEGFEVKVEPLAGAATDWLLAESDLFVVAVAATERFGDLRTLEAFAAPALLERIREADDIGAKRWDAYLVLLASHDMNSGEDARRAVGMAYDTRGVRRLVAAAVQPTPEALGRVLRPFMPLPDPGLGGLTDAYSDLEEALVVSGIDEETARLAVADFKDSRGVDDV